MTAVRLHWRSAAAVTAASLLGVFAFGWPFLRPDLLGSHSADAPWVFVALLPLCFLVIFAELAEGSLDAKAVALLGILAGTDAVLRPLSGGASGFTLVYVLIVCGGYVFGRGFGFSLGALSLLASALLTAGVGPWLPFQMLGAAWVGLGAGCLPRAGGWPLRVLLAAYGAVAALLYGALLNLSFWPFARYYPPQIAFVPDASGWTNLVHWWRFDITTSLGFDVPAAIGNVVLLSILGPAVVRALQRAGQRAAFDARPEFEPARAVAAAVSRRAPLPR